MKLIDKDLMSMQEVRELVESAKEAQWNLPVWTRLRSIGSSSQSRMQV